jgi:hypothetical protein
MMCVKPERTCRYRIPGSSECSASSCQSAIDEVVAHSNAMLDEIRKMTALMAESLSAKQGQQQQHYQTHGGRRR